MNINKLKIIKLNGIYNYEIPITDNKLILVGENGTGKSSILSILNLILSRQWEKIKSFEFQRISITIDEIEYSFSRRNLIEYIDSESKYGNSKINYYIKNAAKSLNIDLGSLDAEPENSDKILEYLNSYRGLRISDGLLRREMYYISKQSEITVENSVSHLDKTLTLGFDATVLYLPTFRRIERELSTLFPHLSNHDPRLGIKNEPQTSGDTPLEIVQFGMADVDHLIKKTLSNLEQSFRQRMKDLMASYLQDIFLHNHETFDASQVGEFIPEDIEKMLLRIDSDTLSSDIKATVKSRVLDLRDKEKSETDKVITHFILKLIELNKEQSKAEESFNSFIKTCNKYLVNKDVIFDSINFDYKIHHTDKNGAIIGKKAIPVETLSSGEKQIVSLFGHVLLSKRERFFIIIDEPELSLSVPWQKTFLEDLTSSPGCVGLIAVTHSPFVFDNGLDSYARSINEFMEYSE